MHFPRSEYYCVVLASESWCGTPEGSLWFYDYSCPCALIPSHSILPVCAIMEYVLSPLTLLLLLTHSGWGRGVGVKAQLLMPSGEVSGKGQSQLAIQACQEFLGPGNRCHRCSSLEGHCVRNGEQWELQARRDFVGILGPWEVTECDARNVTPRGPSASEVASQSQAGYACISPAVHESSGKLICLG